MPFYLVRTLKKNQKMEIKTFVANYREAFGETAELPIVFWYSDTPESQTEKINGCFFKNMKKVRDGHIISLNADVIGCGGGKFIPVLPICRNMCRLLFP